MSWPKRKYSKERIRKAGEFLVNDLDDPLNFDNFDEYFVSIDIVGNWRACHGYPLNTFQSTLRYKLKSIDKNALVAQRLKRLESIIKKLSRFRKMNLSRMQDIGGIRAVVSTLKKARDLEANYLSSRFSHELASHKDYINSPKSTGYRGIHLVYKYKNHLAPEYNNLNIELQIRTKLQHAWATAVETMGTFLNQALKSSEGPEEWLEYFSLSGAAFAHLEKSNSVPGFEAIDQERTYKKLLAATKRLEVRQQLQAFTVAAEKIHSDKRKGNYHLISLDLDRKVVNIKTYGEQHLAQAGYEYSQVEKRIKKGENLQVVLVSAGPIENLRKAYPNYFLDTREYIKYIDRIEKHVRANK